MRIYTHIKAFFLAGFLGMYIIACSVDPLDSSGPPTPGTEGYTICGDTTLVDTDSDGMNDECEKLWGTDPGKSDTDGNGVGDGYQFPPLPPGVDCTQPNLTPEQQNLCNEMGGLGNKVINDVAKSTLLGGSGLNAEAPNGTKVEVSEQLIRIVYNYATSPSNSGLESDTGILTVCKDEAGVQLNTFVYYHIVGDVMYCPGALSSGGSSTCEEKSTTTKASLDLCGPFDLGSNQPGAVTMEKFKWTKGYASNTNSKGEPVSVYFHPSLLQKAKDPTNDVQLTLTPSDLKFGNVYNKLDVKFKSTFKISGTIYGQENIHIETPDVIEVLRKFKRTGTIDANTHLTTPGITGLWNAGE